MNLKAQSLKMLKTKFSNSHGLADPNNKSCCYDLTILCDFSMKNDFFRSLVSTQEYRCRILDTSLQAFKDICW
jgi:D-alanyl-D-alanine carboxypeptidase